MRFAWRRGRLSLAIGLSLQRRLMADDAFDACKGAGGSEKDCGEQWIGREQAAPRCDLARNSPA